MKAYTFLFFTDNGNSPSSLPLKKRAKLVQSDSRASTVILPGKDTICNQNCEVFLTFQLVSFKLKFTK